jgi:hypothetical protein
MKREKANQKFKEWLGRYFIAELLGTFLAVAFAYSTFTRSHSYIIAAGAGFIGEGLGFYGYFIASELLTNAKAYKALPFLRRMTAIISKSSTNLMIEFMPAEVVDNIFVRPFLIYYMPQHVKPYVLGFIVGKLSADAIFYLFAIGGYEIKKRMQIKKTKT